VFQLTQRGTNVRTEALAGATTFLTMSYIIFVNPQILSETGMDRGAVMVATCLAAAASTLIMGLWANVPVAQAPGMGLNAFFTYTVCMGMNLPWQSALGIVFLSGVLNVILAVTPVREMVVRAIPQPLKIAAAVGIGMFLALIGLQHMGVVTGHPETLVTMGDLSKPTALLGLAGLALMAIMQARKIPGTLLLGILVTSAAGMALGYSPRPASFISAPPSLAPTFLQLDIMTALTHPGLWGVLLSFAFVDLFDSVGTLLTVGYAAKLIKPETMSGGTVSGGDDVFVLRRALQADALATPIGALLGTSSTTSYIESAAGAEAGGRTGLTSVFVAALFLLGLFFSPLATSIPAYATAPALVLVGFLMMSEIRSLDFSSVESGLPLFVTMLLMPMTFSISMGLGFGFLTHVLILVSLGRAKEVHPVLYAVCAVFLVDLVAR
jgi:adenine/guanine/hypoxanthine permease